MATVGQPLTVPETGWKRYDDNDTNFSYENSVSGENLNCYNSTYNQNPTGSNMTVKFNVTGTTRLRLIGVLSGIGYISAGTIKVDGIQVGTFTQQGTMAYQILNAEVNLTNNEHFVEISGSGNLQFCFDAIDIDETGELKPYNPIIENPGDPGESNQAFLRITMSDSSEREYKVSKTTADDFVSWCNHTVGTGNSCYVFDKGIQNSKEYLFYEKIISFEVIPVA